ncbi:peptidase S49 [Trinickia dabaoshanensis]|uniref:Peptidase S49 n=1 Tax=Trinickia dabaoshanensis TaxID=564714 RepID=A0A2N7VL16_9BURK|nr:S49 family peptidase [Trinickia dabaoshanensis]PMS17833.1 peptidase S49 [Trinickia dabaoshanensis]
MQQDIAEVLSGPWAILPDRLPFVRAALLDVRSGGQRAIPQAQTYAAANDAIAVLPFYGIAVQRTDAMSELLGLVSVQRFTQALRATLADQAVRGIVIDMDSPGGSVYGIGELAEEIYRWRTRKPIFAIANSLAASGAYWIASAATECYVTPGGEVGGIGVIAAHQDLSQALDKAGIQTTLIAAGKYKTEGNPFQPLGADARAAMQMRVDGYYRSFVQAVAKHRNVPESAVRNGMGQGRLLDAERADRESMVDGIATLDDVVGKLARRIGQRKPVRPPTRAEHLEARQRFIAASKPTPPGNVSRAPELAAARRREIELLEL